MTICKAAVSVLDALNSTGTYLAKGIKRANGYIAAVLSTDPFQLRRAGFRLLAQSYSKEP